jgi:hypothetical protein
MVVGIVYGDNNSLSAHYKKIENSYHFPIYIGKDFWYRLTGDNNFYYELIQSIGTVASQADFSNELNQIIDELSQKDEIISLSKKI